MQIFLHTTFGNLASFYGGSNHLGPSFQGVCQGNGAGPALWLATSIPLIETLCQHGFVSKFSCPSSGKSAVLTGMLYMDNFDLLTFIPSPNAHEAVVLALQWNMFLWQGA